MRPWALVVAISAFIAGTVPASATVRVAIDLTRQRMHVTSDEGAFDWPISSARSGFFTPGGSFRADASGADALFAEVPHVADAQRDLLSWRLRDTRDVCDGFARASGIAWLRAALAGQRRGALCDGRARGRPDLDQRDAARVLPFAEDRPRRQQPVYRAMVRPSDNPDESVFASRRRAEGRALRREQFGYGYRYVEPRQPGLYDDPTGYAYAPRYAALSRFDQ